MVASEGAEVGPAEDEGGNPEAEFREELLGVTGRGLHRVRNSTNSGSERGHVSGALLEVGGKGPLWEPSGPRNTDRALEKFHVPLLFLEFSPVEKVPPLVSWERPIYVSCLAVP